MILEDILKPDFPSKDAPVYSKIRKEAFASWYESGGEAVLASMRNNLIFNIITAINHKRSTEEERTKNLRLLDHIQKDVLFINTIFAAFRDSQKTSPVDTE